MEKVIFVGLGPRRSFYYNRNEYTDGTSLECPLGLFTLLVASGFAMAYTKDLETRTVKLIESANKKREQISNKMRQINERSGQ